MAWRIEFERAAARELNKLGSQSSERVLRFLRDRVASLEDPRSIGQALRGDRFGEFWRYRISDYRVIARIEDAEARILAQDRASAPSLSMILTLNRPTFSAPPAP